MAITTKSTLTKANKMRLPKYASAEENDVFQAHIKLASLTTFGLFILTILANSPYSAILALDLLLCSYLVSLFKNKYKYLFLLHPVILLISSQLFTGSFLNAGDGEQYANVVASYFNTQDLSLNIEGLLDVYTPLEFFKYASLGVVPTFAVPEFFFRNPAEEVYYLWQGTFHVFLCLIVIALAKAWNVVNEKYLFAMALFVVLSPTCFELGDAPTRHLVTLFGVFLLLITHIAVLQRLTLSRTIWYTIALATVVISKTQLLPPYFIFVIFDMFFIRRFKLEIKGILLLGILIFGLFLMSGYLLQTTSGYKEISATGAASFSASAQIPIIGWIIKYVYALLSPFPWSEAPLYIDNNFTGNWLLFFMHTLSALTGLYLFFIVVLKWRTILATDTKLKQLVAFGLIMSLSILKGATGFHGYLSIYFPMLAPLLTIKPLQINPMLPIYFVIIMEAFVVFGK